ncbi:MAG TPA: DUF1697 domain-containing protein [Gammaproteobacteria bacterium]|nr:DUF1697 domain-containing protein [Gammaproteobacteria bacterium]
MSVYVSMLRGVNVGGHGRIKMAALKKAYLAIGLGDVQTLLQSGNVVFTSQSSDRDALAKRIAQEIERRFDFKTDVLIRTLAEVRMLIERGPKTARADPSKLLVMFLSRVPDARAQAALLKEYKGPEMIEIRGPEVYLYYPNGVGRSKLTTAFLEGKLDAAGTARNWNTLKKLVEVGAALERA